MSQKKKFVLDWEEEEHKQNGIIAIKSSLPDYRLAFRLNQGLSLGLERSKEDLQLSQGRDEVYVYALYKGYMNDFKARLCLYSNMPYESPSVEGKAGQLFSGKEESTVSKPAIADKRKPDFILQIIDPDHPVISRKLHAQMRTIRGIVTTFDMDFSSINKREQLIFN